ncbi:MAG: hypothetical protein HKN44_09365 [Ilumatobacter sp.]|nr:hypothetical protein [Ilumatobacter sp.]
MKRHPFDVMSALLGVLAIAAGAITISGAIDPFDGADVGVWVTLAGLAVGLLMLPWGRWSRAADHERVR